MIKVWEVENIEQNYGNIETKCYSEMEFSCSLWNNSCNDKEKPKTG